MIPVIIFAGLAGLIAWAVRPKTTGVVSVGDEEQIPIPAAMLDQPPQAASKLLGPVQGPPLLPEQERLLSLLVLFARDKKYPAGQKRYLTPALAMEAVTLSKRLGLPKTSMAIRKDAAVPDDEHMRGRTESVRELTVKYGTTGRA